MNKILLYTFIFSAFYSAWMLPIAIIGGLNLKLSHVVLLPILIILFVKWKYFHIPKPQILFTFSILILTYYFWTIINSPDTIRGTAQVVLLLINILHFILIYTLVMRTAITIMEIFKFIAICSIVMISWSLLLTILSISGKISLGFIESLPIYSGGSSQLMIVPRLWNGIITGSFCSAFSIIFSAIYFFDRNNEYRKLFGVASLFTFVGLAISFSRGPVIGFIVGVALFYIVTMKRYFMRNIGILMKAIIAVLSIYFIFSLSPIGKSIGNIAIGRIIQAMTISEYKTGTASYRLQLWMPLITDIQNNPFVGQGALAYKKHAMDGGSSENVPLEIFHSTGIIGFLAYIWIHIHIIRLFFKRSNRNWFTIACVGAVVSLFVASLTNPFAWFPLYWLFLGLLIAINNKFSFINKSSYIPLNSNQQIIQMK